MLSNIAACSLFVVFREPASPDYLADVDAARRDGGIYEINTIIGTLACRNLYSWSEWHGGESLRVKVLEVANAPAMAVTGIYATGGELGLARLFSGCTWSWLLAGVFILAASAQWWLAGVAIEFAARRFRRRAGPSRAA